MESRKFSQIFFRQMINSKLEENFHPSFSAHSFLYVKITKLTEIRKTYNLSKVEILSFKTIFLKLNFIYFRRRYCKYNYTKKTA